MEVEGVVDGGVDFLGRVVGEVSADPSVGCFGNGGGGNDMGSSGPWDGKHGGTADHGSGLVRPEFFFLGEGDFVVAVGFVSFVGLPSVNG